jgi:predicted CXXCH cytochrome family protein
VSGISKLSAADSAGHPYVETKDLKSETCLKCHPNISQGKAVHTAVGMGCENCHQTTSEKNQTTITLMATGRDLCVMCHEASKDPVLHEPYKNGQCLTCHDPHSSDYKAQTRADGNALCLACHGPAQAPGETVTLFGSQKISKADFEAIPKIDLDPTLRFGHPWVTHPVAETPDLLHPGEKMSCLSCHAHHSSTDENLTVAVKGAKNVCDACHEIVDAQADAKKKTPPPAGQQTKKMPDTPAKSQEKVNP